MSTENQSAIQSGNRLAWLEGLRFIAAVGILLYHAQMLFAGRIAFSPMQAGLIDSWNRFLLATHDMAAGNFLLYPLVAFNWFGWQFLGIFIWLTGFGLTLSMLGKTSPPFSEKREQTVISGAQLLNFWQKRLIRLLLPFWAVVLISIPILIAIGWMADFYIPSPWAFFTALAFPLTFEPSGHSMLPISGPWWYMPLVLSLIFVFPWLYNRLQQWGVIRFLITIGLFTLAYRFLAVYVLGGSPTYLIVQVAVGADPFKLFLAHLFTVALGMASAVWYRENRPFLNTPKILWLAFGTLTTLLGLIATTSYLGWVVVDMFMPIGTVALFAALLQPLARSARLTALFNWLGARSYVFFLVHNFFVDRLIQLWVGSDVQRYWLSLFVMILGSLITAWIIDILVEKVRVRYFH